MSGPPSILVRARSWASHPGVQRALLWGAAVGMALLLAGLCLLESAYYPLVELPKGSVSGYTVRATHDAVYDLHETFRAEAEEARLTYVPIYNRDDGLPFDRLAPILRAALAEPFTTWRYPPLPEPEEGTLPPDAGPPDLGARDLRARDLRKPSEAGVTDGGPGGPLGTGPVAERRREIDSLVQGCFRLLETFYKDGVVGDSEFPKEKRSIRVLYKNEWGQSEYGQRPTADLHRFSSLRLALERSVAQIYFKTDPRVREQIINYILQRLPPNLTYAKENDRFIGDISQVTGVKVVLIRSGEILVRRGQTVDTRAYYAIRASVLAASETSRLGSRASRFGLLLALMLLFVVATREVASGPFRSMRAYLAVYAGLVILLAGGKLLLVYFPLHPSVVPQAALALIAAVVLGRAPGLLAAILVPACFLVTQTFDLSTLLVGASGGLTAALVVRRRRRGSALAAGILVGLVQALVFEATRALEGRPRTYAELWSAGQAFVSGLLAGGLAIVSLPFVERLLGKSSRGKLRVLTDFDHPLVRELRERAPGTFAHTVTLTTMVELSVEAVGGERLLARAGTLFHDIGKMLSPLYFVENQTAGGSAIARLTPAERARGTIVHVADGLALAKRHRLPPDVAAFIAEHHGTTELTELAREARAAGATVDPERFRYPGPKPQSVETAILMIANAVEEGTRALVDPDEASLRALVERVVLDGLSAFQFDQCGIHQGELRVVTESLVAYLVGRVQLRQPTPVPASTPAAPASGETPSSPAP